MKYRIKEIVRSDYSVFVPQSTCMGLFWSDCTGSWDNRFEFLKLSDAKEWVARRESFEVLGTIIHEVGK